MTQADPHQFKKEILEAATAAVCGERALNYGKPEANFARIAALWNTYIFIRQTDQEVTDVKDFKLTEWDVALMMDMMKTARIMNQPSHKDSWIDKCGYSACGYEIAHDL